MVIINPGKSKAQFVIILITSQLFFSINFFPQKIQSASLVNFETKDSLAVVTIKFSSPSLVYSLLVLITNQEGNTLFLDTRQRFSGIYNKSFSLPKNTKGDFTLSIISDEEKLNRKFSFK